MTKSSFSLKMSPDGCEGLLTALLRLMIGSKAVVIRLEEYHIVVRFPLCSQCPLDIWDSVCWSVTTGQRIVCETNACKASV